ncbi:MAG: accB [Chlamydiales bacterium]|jgi:acetyl-CoA carboxylase biotin carboxyl carrier protein|nr:accB [Chlamydiales bacterium]
MELKQVKELMAAMERTGVTKVVIKEKTYEISLERENTKLLHINNPSFEVESLGAYSLPKASAGAFIRDVAAQMHHPISTSPNNTTSAPTLASTPNTEPAPTLAPVNSKYITSPMVGTFYAKQSPDSPSFVKEGSEVNSETVVCIIEAMKVMNEIKAGINGTIAEVLVQNGQAVEYGTKLFRIV